MPRWLKSSSSSSKRESKPGEAAAQAKVWPQGEQIELQLLAGIREGRRGDFESLYRIYHPRLQRFLHQLMRQSEAVEEVLNDTLMVVWQNGTAFDGRSKLSTWIFGIAYRKAMKALNRQDLPQEAVEGEEPADPGPGPEAQLSLAQLRVRMQQALGDLSFDHRAVVELCYFQEMAYAEIAQIVGCGPETVKTRMFYARKRLRTLLADLAEVTDGERS